MNERELLAAYGSLPKAFSRTEREENVERVKDALRMRGYGRCSTPGCITLIAVLSGRKICRFHSRSESNS